MTEEQKAEVKNLYENGWILEDIAEELGLDESEVEDVVDAYEQGKVDDYNQALQDFLEKGGSK